MSGIGFSELIILFLIGLIVLGPERLPRVANQLGNWIGQARRMTRVMRRQLEDDLDLEKAPTIKPPEKNVAAEEPTPADTPANEHDDAFSPAHDPDSVGSGVNDDVDPRSSASDSVEVADDEGFEVSNAAASDDEADEQREGVS